MTPSDRETLLLEAERVVRLTVGYSIVSATLVLGYAGGLALTERWFSTQPLAQPAVITALLLAMILPPSLALDSAAIGSVVTSQ